MRMNLLTISYMFVHVDRGVGELYASITCVVSTSLDAYVYA